MKVFLWVLTFFLFVTNCYGETVYGKVFLVEKPDKLQVFTADKVTDVYLAGIVSPEQKGSNIIKARNLLASMVVGKTVKCEKAYVDKMEREYYFVSLADETSINDRLLRSGLVWPEAQSQLKGYGCDTSLGSYCSLEASANSAKNSRLGVWANPDSTSPWERRNSVDLQREYLKRVGEVQLSFDRDAKRPLHNMIKNGTKIIATDLNVSSFISPEDIGAVIYRGVSDISLLVASDTYKVPVKEVSDKLLWSNRYKGRIGYVNDSMLCNDKNDLLPEALEGYNFYNCMKRKGWRLMTAQVEESRGMAELAE